MVTAYSLIVRGVEFWIGTPNISKGFQIQIAGDKGYYHYSADFKRIVAFSMGLKEDPPEINPINYLDNKLLNIISIWFHNPCGLHLQDFVDKCLN